MFSCATGLQAIITINQKYLLMPLNTSQTVFLQVTVTADGLQARYIDQSKLDLPAITASARYRFHDYDNFVSNSAINDNWRKKETQEVSAK